MKRSNRLCMICLVLLAFVSTLPATANQTSIRDSFERASQEFGVPLELLVSVSYVTSHWHEARGVDPMSPQEYGVMGLRDQSEGPSLLEAAELLSLSSREVRDSRYQNIRGGAALLAQYAREAAGGRTVASELTLETAAFWWDAAVRYAGVSSPMHSDIYAVQVFEAMDSGLEGRVDTGEMLRIAPAVMPSVIGDWIQAAKARQACAKASPDTDYSGASWVAACSSNYTNDSRTAADISYVIVHKIEGSYSGCISWFQNCSSKVSSHYVISKTGAVTQMVAEADIAWHAGNWSYNEMSVGLEHEGYTYTDDVTDEEYKGSAALTADICNRNGIPKNRTYIIGHNEVPGATHTDPGPYWDWDYYIALINGGSTPPSSTGNLVGYVRENDIYTGAGIAGATVKLSTGSTTTTDSNGFYRFNGLNTGTYTVTASKDCYNSASATKTISAGIDNWGSIALTPTSCGSGSSKGNLVGLVKAEDIYDGVRIAGATVRLNTGATTTTDDTGYYEFLNLPVTTYTVTADADCYGAASVTKTIVANTDNWASLALLDDSSCVPDGNVTGYVRDSASLMAIAGATVTLDDGQTTTSDSNGAYGFSGVPQGEHVVGAEADCYFSTSITIQVSGGQVTNANLSMEADANCGQSTCQMPKTSDLASSTLPIKRSPLLGVSLLFLLSGLALAKRRRLP